MDFSPTLSLESFIGDPDAEKVAEVFSALPDPAKIRTLDYLRYQISRLRPHEKVRERAKQYATELEEIMDRLAPIDLDDEHAQNIETNPPKRS